MAVIVGFHCDVISCELSWPKPAAATKSSACECGNVVGLTSIHDKMQFFSSYADNHKINSALQPSGVAKSRTSFARVKAEMSPLSGGR